MNTMQRGTNRKYNEAQSIKRLKKEQTPMLFSPGEEDLRTIRQMAMSSDVASTSSNKENIRSKKRTKFHCQFCFKPLGSKRSVKGHEKGCKINPDRQFFTCIDCKLEFSRGDILKKHVRRVHNY